MLTPLLMALQGWTRSLKTRLSLDECDDYEISRMARELGLSPGELVQMSKQGSEAAGLLSQRMAALHLDADAIAKTETSVLRDMQRLCSSCVSKKRCQRDLAAGRDAGWHDYCPNADTLEALQDDAAPAVH